MAMPLVYNIANAHERKVMLLQGYLHLFLISMLPLVELRGAMIYAAVADMPFWPSLAASVAGNLLPVPFLILFSKQILTWLARTPKIGPIKMGRANSFFQKIIDKGNEKALKIGGVELFGLFLFVAFPVPGTGAWMGSLIAAILQLRLFKSMLSIAAGVFCCGLIMGFLSFGLANAASWLI